MLRKISDIAPTKNLGDEKRRCEDPSHDPPSMITLDPGVWEHTCPSCRHKTVFTVHGAIL